MNDIDINFTSSLQETDLINSNWNNTVEKFMKNPHPEEVSREEDWQYHFNGLFVPTRLVM